MFLKFWVCVKQIYVGNVGYVEHRLVVGIVGMWNTNLFLETWVCRQPTYVWIFVWYVKKAVPHAIQAT